ncbi:MAG TPA: hypothetical protein VK473_05580 [Terriglobales bacterium]|nr:hypothetical protein [Terriglobales bacterium]
MCVTSGLALLWASAALYFRVRRDMAASDRMLREALEEIEQQQKLVGSAKE